MKPTWQRPQLGPTDQEIETAKTTVAAHLSPTPVLRTALADDAFLKLETLQPTGSFKVRGALTALAAQSLDHAVTTASTGNHGLGMAHAASVLNRKITVVVPTNASSVKIDALKKYTGVEVVEHGTSCGAAEAHALAITSDPSSYISPYNHALVIAGQATIGAELDAQLGDRPLTVVCAVGGGGLCSGLSIWANQRPNTQVVGVEVASSPAVSTAIRANRVTEIEVGETLAHGLVGNLDPLTFTWKILRDLKTPLISVSESEVWQAMRWLFEHHGLVVEGSGAIPVAAVLTNKVSITGTLVVIVSGRNIAPKRYSEVVAND